MVCNLLKLYFKYILGVKMIVELSNFPKKEEMGAKHGKGRQTYIVVYYNKLLTS